MAKKWIHRVLAPIFHRNPALGKAYTYYRFLRSNPSFLQTPDQCSLGFRFNGNALMERGEFESHETRLVCSLFKEVDLLINVGANIGYYSCLALDAGKSIIAFEPIPENLHFLLRNIKVNGWESRAQVYPIALSHERGILEIYGGGTSASLIEGWAQNPSDDMTLVPISTLDDVLAGQLNNEKILFIIDIEGAEKMMLEGASNFINRSPKPLWIIEITSHQHQPQGVSVNPHLLSTFEIFWAAGYEAWAIEDGLRKVTPEEIKDLMHSPTAKTGAPNYLFKAI